MHSISRYQTYHATNTSETEICLSYTIQSHNLSVAIHSQKPIEMRVGIPQSSPVLIQSSGVSFIYIYEESK